MMSLENCKKLLFKLRTDSFKEPNNSYISSMVTRARFMTTKAQIALWFKTALTLEATHLVVCTDLFDHDDYPVYVTSVDDVREVIAKYDGVNMQKVMEVYMMSMDKEKQLAETRAYHLTHTELK